MTARRHRPMDRLRRSDRAAVLTTLLLFAACGDPETEVPEMSEGHTLYETHCTMCHGDAGLGDGPMAPGLPIEPPSLMDHLGHHAEAQLIQIIRTGVPPAMPPSPLTEAQVKLVVDYAWTLVPDSLVEGLREMQRMAEMGMDMEMETGMDHGEHVDVNPDMEMGSGRDMPRDTTRR